jgi:nicotinamide phosphoribosyltransferase
MAGFSVYATEHSIECSFGGGREDALEYIRHQLKSARELGVQILSIVLDGYDIYREAELCCTVLKDEIIASGIKVVFRPDSGDMMEVVPRILKLQEATFGSTRNEKGFRKINYVGIIQGDGVDSLAIVNLLGLVVVSLGYTADCVLFGSGGALLQKVNRDTFKFAQKACALLIEENGVESWVGIAKNPVTDAGKKSKEGVLTLVRSKMTGESMPARLDLGPLDSEFEDVMKLVFYKGQLFNETTLDEIRDRVKV